MAILNKETKLEHLPDHLGPLLLPTPSGIAKLLSVWDGLLVETKLIIIAFLSKSDLPPYLADKVKTKALGDDNPYVRYIALRNWKYISSLENEFRRRIANDPDPLVRFSIEEDEIGLGKNSVSEPDAFLALPHEARLAKVRLLAGQGTAVAAIVSLALDNHMSDGRISETELYEVLADYLLKPSFLEHYRRNLGYDGLSEYSAGRDIESLWRLVPRCPPLIASLLIRALPENSGLSSGIPPEVIAALQDSQLEILLQRHDIGLKDLRKRLFEERSKTSYITSVVMSAISRNFSLDNRQFEALLNLPNKEKNEVLRTLALYARDLRLCIYEALQDYLKDDERWEYIDYAKQAMEQRMASLPPSWVDQEVRELRIYLLAQLCAPLNNKGYPPDDKLAFLTKHVVDGNTWATFVAFQEKCYNALQEKSLQQFLPRVEGVDADLEEDIDYDQSDQRSESLDTVVEKLDKILAMLDEDVSLPDGGFEISESDIAMQPVHFDILFERIDELLNRGPNDINLAARIGALEKSNSKLRYLLYLVIMLLFIVVAGEFLYKDFRQ